MTTIDETFEAMKDLGEISPTRKYVLIVEHGTLTVKEHIYIIKLPDFQVSSVIGARVYFLKYILPNANIERCVTIEQYEQEIVARCSKEEASSDRHLLVSPSRRYVIFYEYAGLDPQFTQRVALPGSYKNYEVEAVRYFFKEFNFSSKVTNCLPYEKYEEQLMDAYLKGKLTSVMDLKTLKEAVGITEKNYLKEPQKDYDDQKFQVIQKLLDKSKLVEEIRISLASFYAKLPTEEVTDSDILVIIERLKSDNIKYLGIIATINRMLKDAARRKDE